jgi:phage tail sheath gpL-like
VAGQIYQLISTGQAANLFGFGSSAHRMATAFLAANSSIPVDIVAFADPVGGTKATASFTVAHQPNSPGSIVINVAGQMVPVTLDPIVDSTTPLAAAAIQTQLNTSGLPLRATATVSGSTVTLTALHAGVYGNDLYVNAPSWPGNSAPAQLSIAPTGAIQFTGGAGVLAPATLATLFATIANTWYTDIAFSFNDSTSLTALCAQLEEYYTAMGMKDADAYVAINATYGSLPGSVSTFNEKCLSVMGLQGCYSPPDEWSASICGAASYASLIDPAKQFREITLPGIMGPDPVNAFTETEQNLLLNDGVSTFNVAADGTVSISRLISTYLTTTLGYPDTAWLDMTRSKVMTRVRWDWRAYPAP